jgi:hypothetical protein
MKLAFLRLATVFLFASTAALGADKPPTADKAPTSARAGDKSATSDPAADKSPTSDSTAGKSPPSDSAADKPRSERAAVCRSDIEKFCADVSEGRGRIARCLKRNEVKLSAACKDEVAQARTRKAARPPIPKG